MGAFTPNHPEVTERGASLLQRIDIWVSERHAAWTEREAKEGYDHQSAVRWWIDSIPDCKLLWEFNRYGDEIHSAFCYLGTKEKKPAELFQIRRAEAAYFLLDAANDTFGLMIVPSGKDGEQIILPDEISVEERDALDNAISSWGDSCIWAAVELSSRLMDYRSLNVMPGRAVSDLEAIERAERNRERYRTMGGRNIRWLPIATPLKEKNPDITKTALAKLICSEYPDADFSSVMRGIKGLFK